MKQRTTQVQKRQVPNRPPGETDRREDAMRAVREGLVCASCGRVLTGAAWKRPVVCGTCSGTGEVTPVTPAE